MNGHGGRETNTKFKDMSFSELENLRDAFIEKIENRIREFGGAIKFPLDISFSLSRPVKGRSLKPVFYSVDAFKLVKEVIDENEEETLLLVKFHREGKKMSYWSSLYNFPCDALESIWLSLPEVFDVRTVKMCFDEFQGTVETTDGWTVLDFDGDEWKVTCPNDGSFIFGGNSCYKNLEHLYSGYKNGNYSRDEFLNTLYEDNELPF